MTKPLVIYHDGCIDGFTAAWVANRFFEGEADFHPAGYGSLPPDVAGRQVLIVDFSYPLDTLKFMSQMAQSILVLDHHKTAQADLQDLPAYAPLEDGTAPIPTSGLWANFDMARSGCGLTFDFLFPGEGRPLIVDFVEDRDLWVFQYKETRPIHSVLSSYPFDFKTWDRLDEQVEQETGNLIAEGEAIDRKHLQMCHEVIKVGRHMIELAGYSIPCCNAPFFMASDIGNIMSEGQPFAATFTITSDGVRVYSLRGRGQVDVSMVAKQFGGGGHANAAGFKVDPRD